jgi:acetyl-CoA carboxylase biotin carboxyl carrier protein
MQSEQKPAGMRVDLELVRELARLLDDTGLTEIAVADGDRSIRVARQGAAFVHAPMAPATAGAVLTAGAEPAAPAEHPGTIKSPMVGTVYLSPEPGSAPYVREGARVAAGDTLLIVEAMKVMNPIVAPKAGIVKAVLVANEQPVEFDQPLAIVE